VKPPLALSSATKKKGVIAVTPDDDPVHDDAIGQLHLLLDSAVAADDAILDRRLVRNLRLLADQTFGAHLCQFEHFKAVTCNLTYFSNRTIYS
jgi:hypothetical protein